jgi:ribosomal protein S18 acetylase RimI-like enzyme
MPNMGSVILRSALPTVDEGRVFARLLDEAQEGWFRAALGRKAGDLVSEAYQRPDNELSYLNVTFAEHDGRIIGMAAGYSKEAHHSFTNVLLEVTTGWLRYRLKVFSRISSRLLTFIDTIPAGDFYVRGLAVDAEHRGEGVGTLLLGALERSAQAAGSSRLALDVAAKNRKARRLYERVGMSAESESRKWFGLPNTNLIRMTKTLGRP